VSLPEADGGLQRPDAANDHAITAKVWSFQLTSDDSSPPDRKHSRTIMIPAKSRNRLERISRSTGVDVTSQAIAFVHRRPPASLDQVT